MELKKFSSPREEALEIAYETRKDIISGKRDVVSVLRSCLVVAKNLNEIKMEKRIMSELSGYKISDVPDYRTINCRCKNINSSRVNTKQVKIPLEIHVLDSVLKRNEDLKYRVTNNSIATVNPVNIERIMSPIVDKCLFFLNDVIAELQYGGIIEYLMEEIRNKTDKKLIELDKNINDEISSLCMNLSSTNPADWPKVAHSCRRILKFVADYVFPSKKEKYKMKDGREIDVKDDDIINRLCAFVDKKIRKNKRNFLLAEIEYFESYLRKIVRFSNVGEHGKKIEKFDADMIATHTYLIVSDIIKLIS